jgi:hypothetical protein
MLSIQHHFETLYRPLVDRWEVYEISAETAEFVEMGEAGIVHQMKSTEIEQPDALIALRRAGEKARKEAIALYRPFHVLVHGKMVNIGSDQA